MKSYRLALIGKDVGYTKSPSVHKAIAQAIGVDIDFEVYDVGFAELDETVKRLFDGCDGFFVTKPFKTEIKRFLNAVDTECGVNFVRCSDRMGFNTDGTGFLLALDRNFPDWDANVKSALVLGAGGASMSVTEALLNRKKSVYVLNRTLMHAVKLCNTFNAELYYNQPAELIVNATTVGLKGDDVLTTLCILPDGFDYAVDLIYEPSETPFLRRCKRTGAKTLNGKDMLVYQAIVGDQILMNNETNVQTVFDNVMQILNGK